MSILDINVLSAIRRPDRAFQVRAWRAACADEELHISAISLDDLEPGICSQDGRGPAFAADLQAWLDQPLLVYADWVVLFDAAAARIWGRLSAEIGHAGADLMIAATALSHVATVVTGNVVDFAAPGVRIEDPF